MAETYGLSAKAMQDLQVAARLSQDYHSGNKTAGEIEQARQMQAKIAGMYGLSVAPVDYGTMPELGLSPDPIQYGSSPTGIGGGSMRNAASWDAEARNKEALNIFAGFMSQAKQKQSLTVPAVQTTEQLASLVAKELASLGPLIAGSETQAGAQKEETRAALVRRDEQSQLRLRGISRHFAGVSMSAVKPMTALEGPKLDGK